MKQIVFYETKADVNGLYGYTTIETEARYARGCEIRNSDGMTIIVVATLPASPDNYQYAKSLMSYSRRNGGVDTFKYNLGRLVK